MTTVCARVILTSAMRGLDALTRALCGLRGHVWLRVVTPDERVALECWRCLQTTPGWTPAARPAFTAARRLPKGFIAWITERGGRAD